MTHSRSKPADNQLTRDVTSSAPCDLILKNGLFYTFDEDDSVSDSVGINDGIITFLGNSVDFRGLAGTKTQIIDLGGKAVTPGLIDTHGHLALSAFYKRFYIDVSYSKVNSIAQMIEVSRDYARQHPKDKWLIGSGWNHNRFLVRRLPTRWDLDEAVKNRPLVLWHTSGHMLVANSKALEIAGIGTSVPRIDNGVIEVEAESGTPTGILIEKSATDLISNKMPQIPEKQWIEAIRNASEEWLSEGVTSVKDPNVSWANESVLRAYKFLHDQKRLPLRITCLFRVRAIEDVERGEGIINSVKDDWLRIPGIKLLLDGAISSKSAWVSRAYKGTKNYGLPVLGLNIFHEIVWKAHQKGYQVCVHAIGDKAIDETIRAFASSQEKRPMEGLRHTIIHCVLPTRKHLDRIARYGIAVELQSPFILYLGDAYLANLNKDLQKQILPLKSMISRGIVVGNGSDVPVVPFPPRYGIQSAVVRKTLGNRSICREEAVTVYDAFKTYTMGAAKCLMMEDRIGSLRVGMCADMVVWESNPFETKLKGFDKIKPWCTIIGGRVVWRAS